MLDHCAILKSHLHERGSTLGNAQATPHRLTAYDFAIGLLAGLTRQNIRAMLAPEKDFEQLSDRAAAATWQHLDERYGDTFDSRFRIYTDPTYGDSETWREALHECGQSWYLFPHLETGMLQFDRQAITSAAERLPGTPEIWDELAEVFLREYEAARRGE